MNLDAAAQKSGRDEEYGQVNELNQLHSTRRHRAQFVVEEMIIIYSYTLVWIHDATYAYNEPYAEILLAPAFDDYLRWA